MNYWDDIEVNKKEVYFSFRDAETGTVTFTQEYDDEQPWPTILRDFIRMLEAFGYIGVADRVFLKDSPFIDSRDWPYGVIPEGDDNVS